MKITEQQLSAALQKGLHPVYWFQGDEPYLIQQMNLKVLSAAKQQGFEKQSFNTQISFDWASILAYQNNQDLFQPKLLLHIDWPNPQSTKALEEIFQEYVDKIHTDGCLLLNTPKLSPALQKSKIYQLIDTIGIMVPVWPIAPQQFPGWLRKEAQARKISFSPEAFQVLCQHHEGNLLSAIQALERFTLSFPSSMTLQVNDVLQDASQGAQFNPFEMLDTLLEKNAKAVSMTRNLHHQGQELLPLLGAFMKTIDGLIEIQKDISAGKSVNDALTHQKVWSSRIALYQKAVKLFNLPDLKLYYAKGAEIDHLVKTYQMDQAWQGFEQLLIEMVGL